jgi:hypothetical protein
MKNIEAAASYIIKKLEVLAYDKTMWNKIAVINTLYGLLINMHKYILIQSYNTLAEGH